MKKNMNFTFKKNIVTGRYRSFELNHIDIKIKGRIVGYISETREYIYKIRFAIKKEKTSYINDMEEKYPPCILNRQANQDLIKEHNDNCDLAIEMVEKMFKE